MFVNYQLHLMNKQLASYGGDQLASYAIHVLKPLQKWTSLLIWWLQTLTTQLHMIKALIHIRCYRIVSMKNNVDDLTIILILKLLL